MIFLENQNCLYFADLVVFEWYKSVQISLSVGTVDLQLEKLTVSHPRGTRGGEGS